MEQYAECLARMHEAVKEWCALTLEGGMMEEEMCALEILEKIPEEMRFHLFFQILAPWCRADKPTQEWSAGLSDAGKHAAIDVARIIGPDYAPGLKAFAALVEKMA